jgi:trimethylamine---corrinoid protein Co-methyltransferase
LDWIKVKNFDHHKNGKYMRANTQFQGRSGLNILSQDQFEEIHFATLEVLAHTGVKVNEAEALSLLKASGARVDGNQVFIPAWMVQEAVDSAPCSVPMANRSGKRVMILEKGRSYYGTGSDTPNTIDIENGEQRPSVKQDVINAAVLCDAMENIDFVMSMGMASDVPTHSAYVHQFEAMVLNTDKPIVYTADNLRDLKDIVQIAEIAAGGTVELAANPFMILYDEPSSPLQHSQDAIEKLLYLAQKRLPIIYAPAVMMGGTGPVTQAGAIIQANCETLSGLVIHQLKAKGAPFVMGGGIPPMDMKTSICSYGAPEEIKNCALMSTIAQYYNLPVFTTSGCSDAHTFDQQAGLEAGFSLLSSTLSGANIIHDLGYIGIGMTSCMEMIALCNEAVGMAKYFMRGLTLTEETKALNVMDEVGPGGNYFAHSHTFKHFKEEMFFPELLNRQPYERWKEAGSTTFGDRANRKIKEILKNHKAQKLDRELESQIMAVAKNRDAECED